MINIGIDAIKISCIAFVGWKTYQTNGQWLESKIEFISQTIKPFICTKSART